MNPTVFTGTASPYGTTPAMASNGFIARFTPEGEHVESKRFGGALSDSGKDLVVLSGGDLLVSGPPSAVLRPISDMPLIEHIERAFIEC